MMGIVLSSACNLSLTCTLQSPEVAGLLLVFERL